jgi:hypothetical protein
MFAQGIIGILAIVGLFYVLWRWVIKDVLIDMNIIEKPVKTKYTERFKKTQEEFDETKASFNAVKKEHKLAKDIKEMDNTIEKKDKKIDKLNG